MRFGEQRGWHAGGLVGVTETQPAPGFRQSAQSGAASAMKTSSSRPMRHHAGAWRRNWVCAGILAGFTGTVAMTVILAAAYLVANTLGCPPAGEPVGQAAH